MEQTQINLTTPIVASESTVWFSAYGFGWGYRAFEVRSDVVCECLGAANESIKQLLLAFQLGKLRLLGAVERKTAPYSGERVEITGEDLRCG